MEKSVYKIQAPKFWGVHAEPGKFLRIILGIMPFILLLGMYLFFSAERLEENPDDKLMPSPEKIYNTLTRVAFEEDIKTGKIIFWNDTFVSLKRILIGASIASIVSLLVGVNLALFRGLDSLLMLFLKFWNMIPPPVLLPALFIVFGVNETPKIVLIVISMAPVMTLAMYDGISGIVKEQVTRSLTLGASQFEILYRIILPQALPRLIEILRTNLGIAWYSLILAEAIAAQAGIGYRIFLVRRYLAMDTIIPYALWVVILGYTMNFVLGYVLRKGFPWYLKSKN